MTTTQDVTVGKLTVAADGADHQLVAEIVASLPVSFAWAAGGSAEIREISGAEDWAAAARSAVTDGVRAVVITNPSAAEADILDTLAAEADAAGVHVVLAERFAANPAIAQLRERHSDLLTTATGIAVAVTENSTTDAIVLTTLRLVRALGLATPVVRSRVATSRGVTLAGRIDDATFNAIGTAAAGVASRAYVRFASSEHSVEVTLPDGAAATPAIVTVTTADGAAVQPTLWETSYRSTWRALHTLLDSGAPANNDALRAYADDIRLAGQ